jgi:hypothetical protein
LPCYCFYQCRVGKPRRSHANFVGKTTTNNEEKQLIDIKSFQSGPWESHYFQYNKSHGPYKVDLTFDGEQSRVTGSGVDDVGMYSIDGIYSIENGRIGLTKQYQLGTGNPVQNLGHSVAIQLEWNRINDQFQGKWYVRTKKFKGEDKFILKFNKLYAVYEKV